LARDTFFRADGSYIRQTNLPEKEETAMKLEEITAILGPVDEALIAEINQTGVNADEALVNDGRSLPPEEWPIFSLFSKSLTLPKRHRWPGKAGLC
jgi:ribosomal protein S12 methylthiotransferase accessory factor YcaO